MELQQCVEVISAAPLGQVITIGAFSIITIVFAMIKKDLPGFIKDVAKSSVNLFKK